MLREEILSEVEERLKVMKGFRAMAVLGQEFRDEIIATEREAEKAGAVGGLMPLVNEGFWRTMERQEQIALVVDQKNSIIRMTSNLLQVKDNRGNLIGEWLPVHRAEDLKGKQHVHFLSDDFVLYRDVPPEGEPHIVLPEVDFPFLHGTAGVTNVTSSSPSVPTDELIRRRLGTDGEGMLSHLVGFDLVHDPLADLGPVGERPGR